jgi:beta-mannosidase
MAPLSCGITRRWTVIPKDKYTSALTTKTATVEIWGSNLTLEDVTVDVVLKAWDVITGRETYSQTLKTAFLLPQNQSTEVEGLALPVHSDDEEGRTVVAVYFWQGGRQIARYVNWPEPLKHVHLQTPKDLRVEVSQDGNMVEIAAGVPVKGVALECDADEVSFSDNLVDVVPGEVMSIVVKGANKESRIKARYLGMGII